MSSSSSSSEPFQVQMRSGDIVQEDISRHPSDGHADHEELKCGVAFFHSSSSHTCVKNPHASVIKAFSTVLSSFSFAGSFDLSSRMDANMLDHVVRATAGETNEDEQECKLLSGGFAALMQVLLGFIAFSVLIVKRYNEVPQRPLVVRLCSRRPRPRLALSVIACASSRQLLELRLTCLRLAHSAARINHGTGLGL